MKIIIAQLVEFENDPFPHIWQKEFESNLIPVVGMCVEDSLWKDPDTYKIVEVTVNYTENYYYVVVDRFEPTIPEKIRNEIEKAAISHGWKLPWKNNS